MIARALTSRVRRADGRCRPQMLTLVPAAAAAAARRCRAVSLEGFRQAVSSALGIFSGNSRLKCAGKAGHKQTSKLPAGATARCAVQLQTPVAERSPPCNCRMQTVCSWQQTLSCSSSSRLTWRAMIPTLRRRGGFAAGGARWGVPWLGRTTQASGCRCRLPTTAHVLKPWRCLSFKPCRPGRRMRHRLGEGAILAALDAACDRVKWGQPKRSEGQAGRPKWQPLQIEAGSSTERLAAQLCVTVDTTRKGAPC